ncbi:MAG TPA: spherulation-specific family 4 protein [Kribbella sp.]|uniref:spherulation-specific family 4 protein n=1 Tax=Kribbella sp. TaxID=1871183 RepID=UPI002D78FB1C|nr:spherulation-specific family 4 protein [Kribbella sp.]HET6296491.1 spherulation-specific family 4 protein [Kribbella sp.]
MWNRSAKKTKGGEERSLSIADLRLAIPWYLHPAEAPEQWAELIKQAQLGRVAFAVVNVDSGPGAEEDPYYPRALASLREGGVPLHGYVDTDYSARPAKDVMADVATWLNRYQVEGIMFDRVSPDPANLPYYQPIAAFARQAGIKTLVGNPGMVPHTDYLETFDVSCVFENLDGMHRRLATMASPEGIPPERLWHLVYGVPQSGFEATLNRVASQGAGLAFVTDQTGGNPWNGLPAELIEVVNRHGVHGRHRAHT